MCQVRILRFLEKTKKKSIATKKPKAESDTVTNEHENLMNEQEQEQLTKEQEQEKLTKEQRLRKKVTKLLKMKKLQQVKEIVKEQDGLKPWNQEAHVKVCDDERLKSTLSRYDFCYLILVLLLARLAVD